MADDNSSSARVLPKKKDFSWTGGYQTTGVRGLASIRNRYGAGAPTGVIPPAQQFAFGDVQNPNIVNPVAAPNPMFTGDMETQSALGIFPGAAPVPSPTAPPVTTTNPSGNPDGPTSTINPNTGFPASTTPTERAEDERQRWLAEGGSDATLHRAQVASGMRPAIDARGNTVAANSTAGAEIRQGWGWEPAAATGSQGAPIAAQMTRTFTDPNTRSGTQQAGWNQKFTDARARLRQSLES